MEKDSKFFDEPSAITPEKYLKSTIEISVVDEDLDKKWDEGFDKGDKIPNRILNNFLFFDPDFKLHPIESLEDETIAGVGEIVMPTSRLANDKDDEDTNKAAEDNEQKKAPAPKEEIRLDAAEWSIGYGRKGAVWVKTPNAWYRLRNPHPLYKKYYQSVYIKYALCVKLHSFMKLEPDDTFEEVVSKMRKSSKRASKSVDKDILDHPLEAKDVMQHLDFIVDSLSELKDDVIARSKCWKKLKRIKKLRNTCHQCKANLTKKAKDPNIWRCDECHRAWCAKCVGEQPKNKDMKCAFCNHTCNCTECKGSNNKNDKKEKTSKKRKQEDTKDNGEKKKTKKAKSQIKYPIEDLKLENVLPNRIHDFASKVHFELYDEGDISQVNTEESAHMLFAVWQFINAFRKILKIKKPISLVELEWMIYSYNNINKNAAQAIQAKIPEHEMKRVDYKTQQFFDSLHVSLLDLLIKVDSKASNLKSAEWVSPDDVIVTMDYLSDLTLNEVTWPAVARQYITLMLYNLDKFDLPYRFDIAKYIPQKEEDSESEQESDEEEKDSMDVENNNNNNNNSKKAKKEEAPTYDLNEVVKAVLDDNSSAHANKNSTTDQANTVMFVKLVQALHYLKDKEYDELSPSQRLAILKILLDRLLECDAVRDEIAAANDGLNEIRKQKYANKREEQEKEQELATIQAELEKNAKVKDPKKQKQTEKQLLKRQKTLESELKKTEKADTKMDQQVFDFKACMRVVCLGEDRHRNLYWLFLNPFGNFKHEILFVEGSDTKQTAKWSVIHSEKQLDKLLSILNTKGIRENALRSKIRKHEDNLKDSLKVLDQMLDAAAEKTKSEISKVPSALFKFLGFSGNAIAIDILVEDVKEQPRFLRRSKRGARKRPPKAANAAPVEVLSDSDNEDEANDDLIIEKGFYRGRILINMLLDFEERIPWNEVKKKKTSLAKRKQWRKEVKGASTLKDLVTSLSDLLNDVDLDEFKTDWSHNRWENALEDLTQRCNTTAEFAIVFSSLKGAFSHLDTGQKCQVCKVGTDEYRMLLCDTCDRGYHIYCLDPPLASIPRTTWRCPACLVK